MNGHFNDAILVVCSDEARSALLLSKLFDSGFPVIGPVSSASMALAIAAHTLPEVALIATPPTGKRNAVELAETLMSNWDVSSIVLKSARDVEMAHVDEPSWTPRPGQVQRLQHILASWPDGPSA